MNVLVRVMGEGGILLFWCDGCSEYHGVWTESPNPKTGAIWTWNGSMVAPTFSPSILLGADGRHPRCHSFIRDGMIQYLPDCAHRLAGKTVALESIDELAAEGSPEPQNLDAGDHVLSTSGNVVHVSQTAGGFAAGIKPPGGTS